jgi:hypothetical protein
MRGRTNQSGRKKNRVETPKSGRKHAVSSRLTCVHRVENSTSHKHFVPKKRSFPQLKESRFVNFWHIGTKITVVLTRDRHQMVMVPPALLACLVAAVCHTCIITRAADDDA